MLTPEENELLTRVVGDAPMGQIMRRHWQPICLLEEVPDPDGTPVQARVMGEDLVVFRDTDGNVGVMDEYCPHRGASLVLGRNEEGGLRCLYHGWKMDVRGRITEMVSEPANSRMMDAIKHKAYPVKEWAGFIWAYMGPENDVPEFQPPAWAPTADVKLAVAKVLLPCNWAQVLEGAIDSAHSSSLHSSDMVPAEVNSAKATGSVWLRPSTDKAPRMQVERTSYGFRYAAIRIPTYGADVNDYVRSTVFVAPATALIPPNNLYNVANINVPMDDENTAFYFIAWGHPDNVPSTQDWRVFLRQTVGVDLDERYRPLRNKENRFWQDREAMKAGNFTGITGFPNQDVAMWVTMGPIANRSRDKLGSSDMAVVAFRKRMLAAIREFEEQGTAIGTLDQAIPRDVCAFQAMVAKSADWREHPVRYVWEAVEEVNDASVAPSYAVGKDA